MSDDEDSCWGENGSLSESKKQSTMCEGKIECTVCVIHLLIPIDFLTLTRVLGGKTLSFIGYLANTIEH